MGGRPIRAGSAAVLPAMAVPVAAVLAVATLAVATLAAGCSAAPGRQGGGMSQHGSGQHGAGQQGAGQHGSGQHGSGRVQRPARISPATRMVTAPGRPSLTVSTAGWPPGAYLLRLHAASGAQRYVPVTVRSPSAAGKVVLVLGVTTWQAYNRWGGYDL